MNSLKLHNIINQFLNGETKFPKNPTAIKNQNILKKELEGENLEKMPKTRREYNKLKNKPKLSNKEYGKFIEIAHGELDEKAVNKEIKIDQIKNSKSEYPSEDLSILENLNDYLKEYSSNIIVHGSYGDRTFTGYSDLDTFIVLKNKYIECGNILKLKKKISNSRYFLHRIDYYQHHGHFITTEKLLKNYSNRFLPVIALEKSGTSLKNNSSISFHINNEDNENKSENLKNMCERSKTDLENPPDAKYYQKLLFSRLMLLPTIYYEYENESIYKGDSFNVAKRYIENWGGVKLLSEKRDSWKRKRITKLLPVSIFRYLHPYYPVYWSIIRDRIVGGSQDIDQELVKEGLNLVNELHDKVNANN